MSSQSDCLWLMIVFTAAIEVTAVMNAVGIGHCAYLMNLIYIPITIYMIVKIMDTKRDKLVSSCFPLMVIILTGIGLYVHIAAHVVANQHLSGK